MKSAELIDTKDIAMLLSVTRAHAVDRIIKRPGFPEPVINLSQRLKRWDRQAVLKWVGLK